MKKIDLFERAIAEQAGSLKDWGINGTAFWAYRKSIDVANDLMVKEYRWKDRSRRDSWTDEMRETARQKAMERSNANG